MHKAFTYRLYPTSKQRDNLSQMMSDHAELYNAALEERREAWKLAKVGIRYTGQAGQLSAIREVRPDQARWSFTSQQQTLRRLDKAFAAFFRRVQDGQTPGYPRFKASARWDSVDFRHGDGIKWIDTGRKAHAKVKIQGVGHVDVRMHRRLTEGAIIGQISIKREGLGRRARWFLVLPVTIPDTEPAPRTGRRIGGDLGVNHLFSLTEHVPVLINGEDQCDPQGHIANPNHYRAAEAELAAAQQVLARRKKGSKRRMQARIKVAALHSKTKRARLDYLHKMTRALVDHADVICVEDLAAANMTRAPKPRPDPDKPGQFLPNGAAAKAGLNKSILDAGWSTFTALLHAKAEEAGRDVVLVNPAYTSRTCSGCQAIKESLGRSERVYTCQHCGLVADRDSNAAINILRAGNALRQTAQAA